MKREKRAYATYATGKKRSSALSPVIEIKASVFTSLVFQDKDLELVKRFKAVIVTMIAAGYRFYIPADWAKTLNLRGCKADETQVGAVLSTDSDEISELPFGCVGVKLYNGMNGVGSDSWRGLWLHVQEDEKTIIGVLSAAIWQSALLKTGRPEGNFGTPRMSILGLT